MPRPPWGDSGPGETHRGTGRTQGGPSKYSPPPALAVPTAPRPPRAHRLPARRLGRPPAEAAGQTRTVYTQRDALIGRRLGDNHRDLEKYGGSTLRGHRAAAQNRLGAPAGRTEGQLKPPPAVYTTQRDARSQGITAAPQPLPPTRHAQVQRQQGAGTPPEAPHGGQAKHHSTKWKSASPPAVQAPISQPPRRAPPEDHGQRDPTWWGHTTESQTGRHGDRATPQTLGRRSTGPGKETRRVRTTVTALPAPRKETALGACAKRQGAGGNTDAVGV